uniref:Uncharacterized protein n=1 Tax=Rhizophora mucronata TaxID=61149 RepID=A0A2P2PT21_RHIMU
MIACKAFRSALVLLIWIWQVKS